MVGWYKHDIPNWMDSTEPLSDPAYRAYHVIIQLIYLHEGPITFHERGIAGRCNQSLRAFRKAFQELESTGKVWFDDDGKLWAKRTAEALQTIGENRVNAGKGGKNSGKSRRDSTKPERDSTKPEYDSHEKSANLPRERDNALKNNHGGEASLQEDRSLKEKTRLEETREEKKKEDSGGADAPVAVPKYAFQGQVVRLNQKDFDQWVRAFPHLDLFAELTARDAFLAGPDATDEDRKRWFISTSKYLANRNAEQKRRTENGHHTFDDDDAIYAGVD